MPRTASLANVRKPALAGVALTTLMGLAGCRASYSADIRNMTPQPLYAQIYERHSDGGVLLASKRLGPGDRGFIGPVRAEKGKAGLVIDTKPNPEGPVYYDLAPGTGAFNVHQRGELTGGPLTVEEVTSPR